MLVIKETNSKKHSFKSTKNMTTLERIEYYMTEEGMSQQDAVAKAYEEKCQVKQDSKTDDDSKYADLFKESVDNSVENVKNYVCSELSKIGITKPNYLVTYTEKSGVHHITINTADNGYVNSFQFVIPERTEVIKRLVKMFVDETKELLHI